MPQVFLPVQDIAHSGGRPTVRVCHFVVSAIFGEVPGSIGGWNQNLLGCSCSAMAVVPILAGQAVNLSDNIGCGFIHKGCCLSSLALVAVRDGAAARIPFFIQALNTALILLLVSLAYHSFHDVQERGESLSEGFALFTLLLMA